MMVDKTGIASSRTHKPDDDPCQGCSASQSHDEKHQPEINADAKQQLSLCQEKSPAVPRTKSNQRWMKLRTTVQLSGAITNSIQKSKPPLKREDSFLKRFSTRQVPETQETVDTGDETEQTNGNQSEEEVKRRRRKRRKVESRTVVNPDENFYFYWLMLVTVCVLYNLWTLIVRQSFPELQIDVKNFWYSCDTFTDLAFICDIIVQFRTGYLEQGLMVYDSKKLAKHYVKSRAFILDVISLIPLQLLQMEIGSDYPILRFPRFFKMYRLYNYYYMVESRTVYPNLWRVLNLVHILLILAHWFGCFYYLLSEAEGFQGAWVYPHHQGDEASLARKYLGSLYWSTLTLTTIGDLPTPETNAEYIFTIVSYLIGVFIFATIVGQVGNVITNRNANRLEFERLLDGAKTYMRHHKVPGGMKRRVLRWYDYSWSRGRIQGGGDINTALGLLPDKLKTELALHVNLSVLKKVTIFQECQPEFLHDLVLKMKAYIFTPGDLICRKGEIAREMFIIADGILDVISDTGRVLTTMKAGDFFGEIGILNLDGLNKRTADVRSVGYSELFSLSREDVLAAMKDYPEAQEILQNLGRKRLMEAKNASKNQKFQGKQVKETDSSGDSDNAGKRIVEKLRSDVKGLKNALRRSRREEQEGEFLENSAGDNKSSLLVRTSHVNSSEEREPTDDGQTPIGYGLPLLQRLKLLKEKEERSRAIHKNFFNRETSGEPAEYVISSQKLMSVKEKSDSEDVSSGEGELSPPPQSPPALDEYISHVSEGNSPKRNLSIFPSEADQFDEGIAPNGEPIATYGSQSEKKAQYAKTPNKFQVFHRQTSIYVPKLNGNILNSVPKQALQTNSQVPKSNGGWNILGKSAESEQEEELMIKIDGKCEPIFGKEQFEMTKTSPSDDVKVENRSLTSTLRKFFTETTRRTTTASLNFPHPKSPSHHINTNNNNNGSDQNNDGSSQLEAVKGCSWIEDPGPELASVEISNERQRLAHLVEKQDMVIRSASLDVPDRKQYTNDSTSLLRSRSVTSTFNLDRKRILRNDSERTGTSKQILFRATTPKKPEERSVKPDVRHKFTDSSGSLQSPESNETSERRHLKSILKKLSAEDGAAIPKNRKRRMALCRGADSDLNKLMRAPTVEGYAARHTKLMKSVTFDRETLPSPTTEVISIETGLQETLADTDKNCSSSSSQTSLLTLHLSNMSLIPLNCGNNEGSADESGPPEENGWEQTRTTEESHRKTVAGIEAIIRRHWEAVNHQFQTQLHHYQLELTKRDEIIHKLKLKIQQIQQGFREGEHCDPAWMESKESSSVPRTESVSVCQDSSLRRCMRQLSSEADELADARSPRKLRAFQEADAGEVTQPEMGMGYGERQTCPDDAKGNELKKESTAGEKTNRHGRCLAEKKGKSGGGGFVNRMARFRKSSSRSRDFVALEMESPDSSDADESGRNSDWEVRMLAEELSKKQRNINQSQQMKKLENDVNQLKKVVRESNLNRLTGSELDMLEAILDAKDEKIWEIASSSCFDIPRGRRSRSGQNHASSFDFHDMESRKSASFRRGKSIPLTKQKSTPHEGENQGDDSVSIDSDDRIKTSRECVSQFPAEGKRRRRCSTSSSPDSFDITHSPLYLP